MPTSSLAQSTASATLPSMHLLCRQPILDAEMNIYGHELLYRSGMTNEFSGEAEQATRSVIDNSMLLTSGNPNEKLFFNCTRMSIVSGLVTLLPPASTVLEILEDVEPDTELLACCRELKESGYSFALDDFVPDNSKVSFLEIADYIKIDFLASDKAERYAIRALAAKTNIKFIAEKVETEPAVEEARKEGCSFFQGYFFCRPVMITPRVIPQNQIIYIRLLAELSREPSDVLKIEYLAKSEPSICYRLLRLVNSVLYALPNPISSVRAAVMMIGDDEFRKLVTVALANMAGSSRSQSVTRVALVRAKFCEFLSPVLNESASTLYLLGMLSLMDVILTLPMRKVVDMLPLHGTMKAALLGQKSPLKTGLDLVRARESGSWLETTSIQEGLNLHGDIAARLYADAIQWADTVHQIA